MRRIKWFFSRLFFRRTHERQLSEELQSTIELMTAERIAQGQAPLDARSAAMREMGAVDTVKESVRDAWAGAFVEQCVRDVRYALRGLRREPGYALTGILTFGLAIGGTTAVATLANALLVKSLPYAESERLMLVSEASADNVNDGFIASAPNVIDWQSRNTVFESIGYYEYLRYNLATQGAPPAQIGGLRTTHEVFTALRSTPLLGRTLIAADEAGTNGAVAVISNALWRTQFNSDSSVIGRSVTVNGQPHTIVGVMRPGFSFPSATQKIWVPLQLSEGDRQRGSHSFYAIGRLKPGVTKTQASADLRRVGDQLAKEYPNENSGETAIVFPLSELWMTNPARILKLLLGAVLFVGVMATANVAGLQLARSSARSREWAARLALGGSRRRLIGQLSIESVVLAVFGCIAGVALAYAIVPYLATQRGLGMGDVPFRDLSTVTIDWRVLAFATTCAIIAGLFAGVLPALSSIPTSPGEVLKSGGAKGGSARRGHALRGTLLALEVGTAVVVLVGTGLLGASMRRALNVEPGLNAHNVFAFGMWLPQKDFYGAPERAHFCEQISTAVQGAPGVMQVSAVSHLPLSGSNAGRGFTVEGKPDPGQGNMPGGDYGVVCPNYFNTLGIRLTQGRDFNANDVVGSTPVVIINQTFEKKHFPNGAIGKRIHMGEFANTGAPWMTIVGVIADVHHSGLATKPRAYLYRPYTQAVWQWMSVVARMQNATNVNVRNVKQVLGKALPDQPVAEPDGLEAIVSDSVGYIRFPLILMSAFGVIGAILTIVGVFGVASQIVVQRSKELGIRRALGATTSNLYQLVITQTIRPCIAGVLGGLVIARLSGKVIEGMLFDVTTGNVATYAVMGALLTALIVMASMIPARRAANVDPARTLRNE